LLLRVYRNQNADGDWPQWFMFFERERNIRPCDSHGDIVFWPVLALAQYLLASDDATFLDELVPFFHAEGDAHAEHATIWQHVERALGVVATRVIPGTQLARTATATGTTRFSRWILPCASGCAAHGP